MPRRTGASEREWIVTPYDPQAWRECLSALGLAEKHAGLAEAMECGFHIGDLAPIKNTLIHPNYPAASDHAEFIRAYVAEQVVLGRMSGPYARADVERVLGSPFISSPLSVVPKANGKLRLVQDCSKEDENGLSVNGRIDSDLFPTRWGSAAEVADLVRTFSQFARPFGPRRSDPARILGIRARGTRSLDLTRTAGVLRGRRSPFPSAVAALGVELQSSLVLPPSAVGDVRADRRVGSEIRGRGAPRNPADCRTQVARAPPGAQVATLDVDAAFRNIPVHPAHKPFLVIQCGDGEFYIDHVVCFGIASGVGLQGRVMDALVDILDALDMGPNKKWVDDLWNMRFPVAEPEPGAYVYGHDVADIYAISKIIRVPWSQAKAVPHGFSGIYSGFLWDLPGKSVSLPEGKRQKYLSKLSEALANARDGRARMSWKTATSLNGTLSHICFVYPQGRAFLTNLCAFIASFGERTRRFAPRYPTPSMMSDLKWWQRTLQAPGIARSLRPRSALRDPDIWVDASSDWGIGLVARDARAAWRWSQDISRWKRDGRDIGWAEMVAMELAARFLEQEGARDEEVILRGDNMGVIGALEKGRSRNFQVNDSIRRTEVICMASNILLRPRYVNTKTNRADPVSRGIPDARLRRINIRFTLPPELSPFLVLDA